MNKRIFYKTAFVGSVSVMAMTAVAGGSAFAQDDDQQGATEIEFEEIIVTAGRREQSLQNVPAAVTAIEPEKFTTKGLRQLNEILNYTPGVYFTSSGRKGVGNISARGVPQSSSLPVFGIYLDDTPVSTSSSFSAGSSVLLDAMLMDIERVEVIKGPQGTLYGATSVGGMMRYISKDPALEEFRASIGADLSTTASGGLAQIYNARVSAPIVEDKLGITLSGFYQDDEGYVDYIDAETGDVLDEDVDTAEVTGFAADVLFKPTDKLNMRFKYMRQDGDYGQASTVTLVGIESDDAISGKYTNTERPPVVALDYEIISGTASYDFGWATLSSTSSWVDYNVRNSADSTMTYAALTDYYAGREPGTTTGVLTETDSGSQKFVQELRLTAERMGNFEWLVGLYYANEDTFNDQSLQATPAYDLLTIAFPSVYKEYAAFGDVTYYLTENFDVTAGLRISNSATTLTYTTSGLFLGVADLATDEVKDTVDTWLFSARYRPTDDLSLYTRIASGYRPASANLPVIDPSTGQNIAPNMIESDTAWSYEIGAKGSFADNVFSYDVALWKIDWTNFQSSVVFNNLNTGGNSPGGLDAHGFEGTFTYRPLSGLSLTTNVNYSISELNEDEVGIGGVAGEQYAGLPKWTGSMQANYMFDLGAWAGDLGFGARYNGSHMSTFSQSSSVIPVKVDSRFLVDMNLSVGKDNLTFGLYATNLFNDRSLLRRADNLLSNGQVNSSGVFERPRTIGVNMKLDF